MSGINNILGVSRKHLNNLTQFKKVIIVLGNESCDLDSAISSIIYSILLDHKKTQDSIVFPVLNIPSVQLPVKTELNYFLRKNHIDVDNIICKDEIDLCSLYDSNSLQLNLVDHHVLDGDYKRLQDSVLSVIDHRPQDPAWLWPQVDLTLQKVGSCCTLVAEKLLTQAPELVTPTVALLLLGVIIIDTNVFSPSAGLASALDIHIADKLESLCIQPVDRNTLFNELQSAKQDVSSLTSAQLLIKDMKVTAGIPIAGFPIKVKKFLERKDAVDALNSFCFQFKTDQCVLYGMEANPETITRDLAVYSSSNSETASKLVLALKESTNPDLKLHPISCSFKEIVLFEQLNVKATRKQILPIVKKVAES
ncbi:exopolyphosphatase PRUNE1 [Macrosteles quadrilineatus]|uniref:exopolyphosphatase PRUNE1 n=1 Tax=Macrosteles quadrilineatus TaxID=74068 RepID=UPI0023E0E80A|nr:exopolyphosphatase PRUNE1 [Macrosteles quadrilineatus]